MAQRCQSRGGLGQPCKRRLTTDSQSREQVEKQRSEVKGGAQEASQAQPDLSPHKL